MAVDISHLLNKQNNAAQEALFSNTPANEMLTAEEFNELVEAVVDNCASIELLQNPDRIITYTTYSGKVASPDQPTAFGVTLVSNTYENGKGVMVFDGPITHVGDFAFSFCSSFKTINLPNSVQTIGECAFSFSGLSSIVIPESVTFINHYAFEGCSSLEDVTIPDNVSSIGSGIFKECGKLKHVKLPKSLVIVAADAFQGCGLLQEITIPEGVTTIAAAAFDVCSSLANITLPSTLTTISRSAFYDCQSLTEITIPEKVSSIGEYAFRYCESLKKVYCKPTTPPAGVVSMFDSCSSDLKICVPYNCVEAYKTADGWSEYADQIVGYHYDANGVFEAVEESLLHNTQQAPNKTITYTSTDGNIVTPNDPEAFGANIVSNTYENGMGRIEFDAPVTTIGKLAFDSCSNLKSISIPQGVTTIGDTVFSYCSKLNAVTIPDTVTSIGWGVFAMTDSLVNITIPGSVPVIKHSMFEWSGVKHVTLLEGVTKIENNAFSYSHIASIDIPNSLTSIGDSAFSDCGYLTSIVIPGSVTSIGNIVFHGCNALKSVELLCDLKNIPNTAFGSCGFTSIHIPGSVTSIGDYAFSNCPKLEELTIPEKVISIGKQAFRNAGVDYPGTSVVKNLKALYIKPSTPPTLGENALDGLDNCQFCVPYDSVEAYRAADGWSAYADRIVGCHYYNEGAIPTATTEKTGVMSAADKANLDKTVTDISNISTRVENLEKGGTGGGGGSVDLSNYYTKKEIDEMSFVTADDLEDAIAEAITNTINTPV